MRTPRIKLIASENYNLLKCPVCGQLYTGNKNIPESLQNKYCGECYMKARNKQKESESNGNKSKY